MKLYSKDNIIRAAASMQSNGRMSHGFLLTGDKGTGRKTTAMYLAKVLMCSDIKDGIPCGTCRHCRRIDSGIHPDVITPERSGAKQIYSRDTIREVCSDAYVAPNDCDAKVYLFPDCENIEESTQNLMLKLIEEPPDSAYFIFTAPDKSVFLPTIISRVITFGVPECSEEECRKALEEMGKYTSEQINDAVEAYHGNIGNCIEYIEKGTAYENAELCRQIINSIISGSEYELNKVFYSIGEKRDRIKAVLELADKVIRDVCIIRLNGRNAALIGCSRSGALTLSERLSFRKAQAIHEAFGRTIGYCHSNVNVPLAVSALCGMLSG